jgi:RNA polymerase sigma-70 factor (ECF subfamily)
LDRCNLFRFSKVFEVKGGENVAIQSLRTDDCVDEVIEKYANMVYRLALAHVKTKHDADDVFQEVFLRYIAKPRVFDSEEHRKAWLIRVTIHRCKSFWSSKWLQTTEPLDDTIPCAQEAETDLFGYLALLPKKYRSVIHLFYYEKLSAEEIGQVMNAKAATVRVWLSRARAMLKDKLEGESS